MKDLIVRMDKMSELQRSGCHGCLVRGLDFMEVRPIPFCKLARIYEVYEEENGKGKTPSVEDIRNCGFNIELLTYIPKQCPNEFKLELTQGE